MNCAGPAAALGMLPPAPAAPAPPPAAGSPPILRAAQERLRSGDAAGSLALLDRALAAAPQTSLLHLGRAVCLAELGRDEEADDALASALACPQADGPVALQLAAACARKGAGALAMSLLETAIAVEPAIAARALDDASFAGLRDHPRFLLIVGAL